LYRGRTTPAVPQPFGPPRRAAQATAAAAPRRVPMLAALVATVTICVLGAAALVSSRPAPLTSDESLYFAEAVSIAHGDGAVYSTGETVIHRPFLLPAFLAAEIKLGADDAVDAYWLPRLAAVGTAIVLAALAWRLFGATAGLATAALTFPNQYLLTLGNSLYLDITESLFLLGGLLLLTGVLRRPSVGLYAGAGAALAAAFWVKESALLWTPLPLVLLAFCNRRIERADFAGLGAYALTLGVPLALWWLWVDHHSGMTFLLGDTDDALPWVIAASPLVAATCCFARSAYEPPSWAQDLRLRRVLGGVLLAAWCFAWLYGLETHSWPHAYRYVTDVPRYFWEAGANVQPFFLILPAWAYVAGRASRGDEAHKLLGIAALLFLPFFIFTANRGLALRDNLPLVYLTLAAIGVSLADGATWIAARLTRSASPAPLLVAVAVVAVGVPQILAYQSENYSFDIEAVDAENWHNELARRTAVWVGANVAPGTPVMTSRLYYSAIFSENDGRYPVHQLPTLRVQFRDGELRPMSTQFRWEDERLASYGQGPWLYLRRYPGKGYDIGLAQGDIIADLRERRIGYLIVTGEDAAFSSLTYLDYFLGMPGLTLVHVEDAGLAGGAYVFRVDAARLAPRDFPLTVSRRTDSALREDLGAGYDAAMARLAPETRVTDETGLPPAAMWQLAALTQPSAQ